MRGGFSSAFSSRQEVANNAMLPEFEESKDVSSIICIDANNLYGGILLHYPLPLKDFELVEDISLDEILQTEDEGGIGFLVEGDLEYPKELHDKHANYPLVLDKESTDPLELSDFQTSLINALKLTASKNYVVHYRNLKFYVNNDIKITKDHQAVKSRQSKWLPS